jgi:MoaA/NifB/PqqE/SkfB family radical SAM enzyme
MTDLASQANSDTWHITPTGDPRGYIQPESLKELWFHTGTKCNLSCDFCLEGSSPSSKRLESPKLSDVTPYIDEALTLGTEQFSFTGGEPMLVKDIVAILAYALQHKPCLVLTNGTDPLIKRIDQVATLLDAPHAVSFRVSLDHPDSVQHDLGRGQGEFQKALIGMRKLHQLGFNVSVARHIKDGENTQQIEQQFADVFALNNLPKDLRMVAFPDFLPPGSLPNVPHITEHCMTTYQTAEQRSHYMCASSKMMVKQNGKMGVYACTLVDDDPDYNLGPDLSESMQKRISMKHHRCYSCFAMGASCSEM